MSFRIFRQRNEGHEQQKKNYLIFFFWLRNILFRPRVKRITYNNVYNVNVRIIRYGKVEKQKVENVKCRKKVFRILLFFFSTW